MSVTVVFEGICTHVKKRKPQTPWLPVPHRVVLANARNPGFGIPDHVGTLHIEKKYVLGTPERRRYLERVPGEPYVWKILGAALSIPCRDKLEYPNEDCMLPMPHVEGFGVDEDLLTGKTATAKTVDAFFDITAGTFSFCCFGDAYGATLTLGETGPEPVLVIKPFSRLQRELRIRLTPNAVVEVRHTAGECSIDDRHHFLLHYLIGRKIPKVNLDELTPCRERKTCGPCLKGEVLSLGVGCSSSGYP